MPKRAHSVIPKRVSRKKVGRKKARAAAGFGSLKKTKLRAVEKNVLHLKKFEKNPIIQPDSKHPWESKAAFNPAALYEDGKVHLVYRAIGDSDISVLGYASSKDGLNVDERLDHPIYVPREPFEGLPAGQAGAIARRPVSCFISPFMSGGGWGGCEDPRLTRIGNRIYMTYVAYDGCNPPRVALTSIALEDFLAKNWRWAKPVLISPPGVVDKNACILPETINGKYVIFHRIFPDILIDFADSLDEFDGKTRWLKGEFKISPRPASPTKRGEPGFWDSLKVGAGAPPIKTPAGWLLIYQAVGIQDYGRYKIGAMLLDLKNPAKVIARSSEPILEPEERYENEGWKRGVVYPCGAVAMDKRLLVYYGGADTVTCVAWARMEEFLGMLVSTEKPKLKRARPLAASLSHAYH